MTLSTEDIKEIAKGLYPDQWEEFKDDKGKPYIVVGNNEFNPLGDADCMRVLRALKERCVKQGSIRISINCSGEFIVHNLKRGLPNNLGEFNNESICRAFLAVKRMGDSNDIQNT